MRTEVYKINKPSDLEEATRKGAELLRAGGLVAFPTETVYGLAANAAQAAALERLRELKARPKHPFTVHLGNTQQAFKYVAKPPDRALRLMRKAWPGPVTIILPVEGRLADPAWDRQIYDRLVHEGTVGLRCPAHPVSERMLSAVEDPVVAPSANPAGLAPPTNAQQVLDKLDGKVDLVIDAGATRLAKASTIVAFTAQGGYTILREGTYDQRILEEMMRRRILFVCSGNTCRSPMAAALARMQIARNLGCKESDLVDRGWEVLSAGTGAMSGAPASPEAVQAVRELGGKIGFHRSQSLDAELINSSDLIFCMTDRHLAEAIRVAPSAVGRAFLLDPEGSIPDPVGSDLNVYRQVARHIQQALEEHWSEGLK